MEGGCSAVEPFALQVLGDSMEPEFAHGAVIVVDPGGIVEDGVYVVAQHADEFILRQLRRREGRYLLEPINPRYPTLEVAGVEAITGVVVQQAGRRRRDHKRYG